MGLFKGILTPFLLVLAFSCSSSRPIVEHQLPTATAPKKGKQQGQLSHIFFLIQSGKTKAAIDAILEAKKEDPYLFHTDILQQLGLKILEGSDAALLHTLYGCSIACDERTIPIARRALAVDDPQIQLTALFVLAGLNTDEANLLLEEAMKSDYLIVRLESAYLLAKKRVPSAYGQIEALRLKMPPEIQPLFAELFAIEGSMASKNELKRLLFDTSVTVQSQAVLAITQAGYDDLLPEIRKLLHEPDGRLQEVCAYACGRFHDEQSKEALIEIARYGTENASLAADYALFLLGYQQAREAIEQKARNGDPFAIGLLAQVGAETRPFLESSDANCRINAALSALEKRQEDCLFVIAEALLAPYRDYAYQQILSLGGSLRAWKVIPSASSHFADQPFALEVSLRMRESLLQQAVELPEEKFLSLVRLIFERQQKDLIPVAVHLLESMESRAAVTLLKEQEERIGAPLTRAWCQLALLRLNEKGPYLEDVRKIVASHQQKEVLQARPFVPWVESGETFSITYEEGTQLLIESFIALAKRQDDAGIAALLEVCREANPSNRAILAGLLMRSAL